MRIIRKTGRGILLILLCALAVLILSGCGGKAFAIRMGLSESPFYQDGDTEWDHGGIEEYYFNNLPSSYNEIYRELYSRLSNREDSAELYARVSVDDFWKAYYAVLADHPELFWIGSSAQVASNMLTGHVMSYEVESTVDPEQRDSIKQELEDAADRVIAGIDPSFSDYGKIKAVYEYLINTTDYQAGEADSQCVQSALLSHASVCAGYAKAFQYILHRMGFFCSYVTGSIRDGGDHAWNIVRIDGIYYHVDVTWGDPVFADTQDGGTGISVMNYNYLCCTDRDILTTHVPDETIALPACTEDYYNFYKLNGMYYETWDYQAVYDALMNSVYEDRDYIVMKFGSAEAYNTALIELFDNNMINDADQYLMGAYGVSSWNVRYATDDSFHVITIQWK